LLLLLLLPLQRLLMLQFVKAVVRPHQLFYYVILSDVKTAALVCPLSKLAGRLV